METNLVAQLQEFQAKLNREPDPRELDATPDGKASTLPISFVEMTLDELFLGQWGTRNFSSKLILNEVVGELELWCINPISGKEIVRVGAASIIIQVDALTKEQKETMTKQQINLHALSPENKKSNALDLGYPKLKAECVKNAAQSLGKIFGRDVNRRKFDQYQPAFKQLGDEGFNALLERVRSGRLNDVALAKSTFLLTEVQINELDFVYNEVVKTLSPEHPKQLSNGTH
jgi:hypothetical protein